VDTTIVKPLRSGELAHECGVSTDTLRHYERVGVLAKPRRTASGYRQYPPEAVKRVRLVRRALEIGFTLEELAEILRVRDSGGAPCKQVRSLAAQKLNELGERINDLCDLREHMRRVIADWDGRLASAAPGTRAGLLEALLEFPTRRRPVQ
jgi:DNA-binding transcriptional MerR regulator